MAFNSAELLKTLNNSYKSKDTGNAHSKKDKMLIKDIQLHFKND